MASLLARSAKQLRSSLKIGNLIITNKLSTDVGYSLVFKQYGDPATVLEKVQFELPKTLENSEVLLEMLAAPINPADINMIQGMYAIKPELPTTAGFEGVGKVLRVGKNVTNLNVKDWVLPVGYIGTWCTHRVVKQNELKKVPNNLPLLSVATISVNPCTAYRMLKDFESLKPGDVVIQNAANSGVGQATIQIAKEMGLVTINVVRDRPDIDKLKQRLCELGADHVITSEELRNAKRLDFLKSVPKPRLALNGVNGPIAVDMMKLLDFRGTVVTYGGMSRQPLTVPTGGLIFQDLRVRGFWMSRWRKENGDGKNWDEMLDYLFNMIRANKLHPPACAEITLDNYEVGVKKSLEGFVGKKQVFVFGEL